MIGCAGLMAAIILLLLIGINTGAFGNFILLGVCIPMHILMLKGMHENHKDTIKREESMENISNTFRN